MIRVEIEKPFLIGGSAQVDIFNKTSYFNFLIESWGPEGEFQRTQSMIKSSILILDKLSLWPRGIGSLFFEMVQKWKRILPNNAEHVTAYQGG